jgi:hypothetical protein
MLAGSNNKAAANLVLKWQSAGKGAIEASAVETVVSGESVAASVVIEVVVIVAAIAVRVATAAEGYPFGITPLHCDLALFSRERGIAFRGVFCHLEFEG